MPVVMVSKNDGTLLKEFLLAELQDLTNNEEKKVRISITFNKVNPNLIALLHRLE